MHIVLQALIVSLIHCQHPKLTSVMLSIGNSADSYTVWPQECTENGFNQPRPSDLINLRHWWLTCYFIQGESQQTVVAEQRACSWAGWARGLHSDLELVLGGDSRRWLCWTEVRRQCWVLDKVNIQTLAGQKACVEHSISTAGGVTSRIFVKWLRGWSFLHKKPPLNVFNNAKKRTMAMDGH